MSQPLSGVFSLKIIPNLITLLNLFLGCIAIVMAFDGYLAGTAMLIVMCSVLDFLDGTAARLLNARSEIGKQLDSLADLISFGFAPSAIAYHYISGSSLLESNPEGFISYMPYLAFLITIFSAIRLARFNIDTRQTNSFIGLPTPANALFFASFPLVLAFSDNHGIIYNILSFITSKTLYMTSLVVVCSYLLVSPIHMFALKFKNIRWKENITRIVFLSVSLLLILTFGLESLTIIMLLYILMSLFGYLFLKNI